MDLPTDWRDFINLLNAHGVRYLVVGAHALAANARPRATQDIDFWVEPSRDNAERVCAALVDFGFGDLAVQVDELAQPERMATLGRPPLRIDLMTRGCLQSPSPSPSPIGWIGMFFVQRTRFPSDRECVPSWPWSGWLSCATSASSFWHLLIRWQILSPEAGRTSQTNSVAPPAPSSSTSRRELANSLLPTRRVSIDSRVAQRPSLPPSSMLSRRSKSPMSLCELVADAYCFASSPCSPPWS